MASSVCQESPLERMPLEVLKNIICQLDDVRDMANAIRACPQIWAAYKEFTAVSKPTQIATRVLLNRLDADGVRGAALWTHEIRSWDEMDQDEFEETCEDEFNPPDEDFCPPLSFGAIASINKLHDTVTRFANAYAQDVIIASLNKRHGQVFSRLAVISKSEIGRIMRALYNLEMYFICCREQLLCELDSQEEYISTGILPNLDHLLRKFAPWNVEQMAGVWEYMMVTVIPAYEELEPEVNFRFPWRFDGHIELMASDTAIVPISFTSMVHPEMMLCQGLQKVEYYISQNIDRRERRAAWSGLTVPHEDRIFRSIYHHCETRLEFSKPVSDLTLYGDHSAVLVKHIKDMKCWATHFQPLFYSSDLDEGQFEVWKASHPDEVPQRAVYRFQHRLQWYHRSQGIYFYDKARIDIIEAEVKKALEENRLRLPLLTLWQSG